MKKITFWIVLILCISLFLAIWKPNTKQKEETKTELTEEHDLLDQLTLEEKIGQLFIISYSSEDMEDTLNIIQEYKPGGIILFKDNFTSYEDTLKQIEQLERATSIPLFISTDQEGGKVQRLKDLEDVKVTTIPPMQILGNTNDALLSYDVGKVVAEELQVFGINMDFAPVLDVVSNPNNQVIGNRSFGSNIDIVSKMGLAFADGLKDNGVIPVYKHFPGHGSTISDSHYVLPVITKTKEELLKSDLVPFQNAIDNGADVIMIGHLAVPSITGDETPASLSKELITGLLKEEMGYQGLVITDALNMGALTKYYSEKEVYEMAINAGVDILLMPIDISHAVASIKESIAEGKITEQQIDESVRKILALKSKKITTSKLDKEFLGSQNHQSIINKISEKNSET